ncbi:MAG: S8 family serine peptidase [Rhodospirillaceae bacterium]|nr:S8 family serine peptidase [Rhodospirillaceae bacterium]
MASADAASADQPAEITVGGSIRPAREIEDRFNFDSARDLTAESGARPDGLSRRSQESTEASAGFGRSAGADDLALNVADQNVAPAGAYSAGAKSDAGFEIAAPELERMFVPTDDLFDSQWHLLNAGQLGGIPGIDINVTGVWDDYTGAGIRVGVIDDGVQCDHFDLDGNYDPTGQFDYGGNDTDPYPGSSDFHGTAVAGLIAAEQNGSGVVGAAFDASITAYRIFGGTVTEAEFADVFNRQADLDVANNSWGYNGFFFDNLDGALFDSVGTAIDNAVTNGRDGLGTVLLWAAGNDRLEGQDVNYHGFQNARESIAVAAIENSGEISFYSTPGAAILVGAPSNGGSAGIATTDRTGSSGYAAGDFTFAFGGTSAATPITAGVVALMLEANPLLGYRDVQEILAYSARQVDFHDSSWAYNGAYNWNGGGLHTSHDFGFGLVDAHAAVRLAETWTDQGTRANETSISASSAPSQTIFDNQTITDTISIGSDIDIDHVEVALNLTHSYIGDLTVTLTAPDGTESVLVNRPGLGV